MSTAFLPLVGVMTLLTTGPVLVPVIAAVTLLAKTFEIAAPYVIAVPASSAGGPDSAVLNSATGTRA